MRWQKKQDHVGFEDACATARREKRGIEFIVVGQRLGRVVVVGEEFELTWSDSWAAVRLELPG